MQTISELLETYNQNQREKLDAQRAIDEANLEANREFARNVRPHFDDVISPAIKNIVREIISKGHQAYFAQDLLHRDFDGVMAHLSITIRIGKVTMQLDILSNQVANKFSFEITGNFKVTNKVVALSISEATKDRINQVVVSALDELIGQKNK